MTTLYLRVWKRPANVFLLCTKTNHLNTCILPLELPQHNTSPSWWNANRLWTELNRPGANNSPVLFSTLSEIVKISTRRGCDIQPMTKVSEELGFQHAWNTCRWLWVWEVFVMDVKKKTYRKITTRLVVVTNTVCRTNMITRQSRRGIREETHLIRLRHGYNARTRTVIEERTVDRTRIVVRPNCFTCLLCLG